MNYVYQFRFGQEIKDKLEQMKTLGLNPAALFRNFILNFDMTKLSTEESA